MDSTAVNLYNLDTAGKPIRTGLCTSERPLVVRMVQSPTEGAKQPGLRIINYGAISFSHYSRHGQGRDFPQLLLS